MEPGGSRQHSQDLCNNPYPKSNQPNSSYLHIYLRSILIVPSHLRLDLSKSLLPVAVSVKILRALLPSSILAK